MMRASAIGGIAAAVAIGGLTGCAAAVPARHGGAAWRVAYTGYGYARVTVRHGADTIALRPASPAGARISHAALVLSRRSQGDLVIDVRMRTSLQLRRPRPNPWEVGWLVWHYRDDRHFYYLALKPNGWELGKEDPAYPGGQHYLATGSSPAFPLRKWYGVRVRQRGPSIEVTVDGKALAMVTDTPSPYLSGRAGFYTEDAAATFEPVSITTS